MPYARFPRISPAELPLSKIQKTWLDAGVTLLVYEHLQPGFPLYGRLVIVPMRGRSFVPDFGLSPAYRFTLVGWCRSAAAGPLPR